MGAQELFELFELLLAAFDNMNFVVLGLLGEELFDFVLRFSDHVLAVDIFGVESEVLQELAPDFKFVRTACIICWGRGGEEEGNFLSCVQDGQPVVPYELFEACGGVFCIVAQQRVNILCKFFLVLEGRLGGVGGLDGDWVRGRVQEKATLRSIPNRINTESVDFINIK